MITTHSSLRWALAGGTGSTITREGWEVKLGHPRRRKKIADGSPPLEVRSSNLLLWARAKGIVGHEGPQIPHLLTLGGCCSCWRWLLDSAGGSGRCPEVVGWAGGGRGRRAGLVFLRSGVAQFFVVDAAAMAVVLVRSTGPVCRIGVGPQFICSCSAAPPGRRSELLHVCDHCRAAETVGW